MKIRSGFVSNSSSSSFIAIATLKGPIHVDKRCVRDGDKLVVDRHTGCCEFGWAEDEHNDFGSKLIFAYLQAEYLIDSDGIGNESIKEKGRKWLAMLEKVIKDKLDVKEIVWNVTTKYGEKTEGRDHAYIDHQSASYEGENTEMFESEQSMTSFLFNSASYIQTGNDNC